jgi:hypothetical protein
MQIMGNPDTCKRMIASMADELQPWIGGQRMDDPDDHGIIRDISLSRSPPRPPPLSLRSRLRREEGYLCVYLERHREKEMQGEDVEREI